MGDTIDTVEFSFYFETGWEPFTGEAKLYFFELSRC